MKTISQAHVPYNTGWSGEMKKGQVIRITATTTVDFVFSNCRTCANASIRRGRKSTT